MNSANKIVVGFMIIIHLCSFTMEQSEVLSKDDSDLVRKFLTSLSYKNPFFMSSRSDADLYKIIAISNHAMNKPKELESLNYFLRLHAKKGTDIKNILNEIINASNQELHRRNRNLPNVAPCPLPIVVASQKISDINRFILKSFLQAEIKNDIRYINTRPVETLESVIYSANIVLQDNGERAYFQNEFKLSEKQLNELLSKIMLDAPLALKRLQNIGQEEAPKIIPAPQQIIPEAVKAAPIAIAEQPEEEIRPNKLYIRLDIKELNANGQHIRWQTPINGMIARLGNKAEFVPNDYFHITLAWIETKKALDPAVVAKFERALAHAAEIFKIVFPRGIQVSLLDGAVFLGYNAIGFRVAESADLKKMQDIFLKFLSFENIEGVKFSTFDKETPIHVTLGNIRPAKIAPQFQNSLASLSAPDGARASQGQSFIINTFRLTYTIGSQAWQEKMSYKF